MARYIARSAKYGIGVREADFDHYGTEIKKKLIAQFQQGACLDHEIEVGLKTFTFRGLPDGVPPETRLAVFDTRDFQKAHRLTDEEREQIEFFLDHHDALGNEYIKVEEIRAAKPFPSYDEKSPEEILELIEQIGTDPDVAYAYEAENEGRDELLEAFVALGAGDVGKPKELDALSLPDVNRPEIFASDGSRINVRA